MLIHWPNKERSFQNLLEYVKFQKSLTLTACLFKAISKISVQFASFTLVENLVSPHTKPRLWDFLSKSHLQSCTVFIFTSRDDDFWPGLWDFRPTRLRSPDDWGYEFVLQQRLGLSTWSEGVRYELNWSVLWPKQTNLQVLFTIVHRIEVSLGDVPCV